MAVLKSFEQETRKDSGACGRHQYSSAASAPTEGQLLASLIVKTEKFSKSVTSQR